MLRLYLLLFLLAVLIVIAAGCDSYVDEDELIQQGELVYIENCARCHQQDGEGYPNLFPNLNNNPVVTLHDPIPIIQVVLHGRGSMPPFRASLNNEELAAVLSYIRNAWDNDASVITPKQTK